VAAPREEFQTEYFWQFCRNFSRFLAHPVATIAKSTDSLWMAYALCFREKPVGIALPFIGDAFVS